jgi:signal transduction histidine kinase
MLAAGWVLVAVGADQVRRGRRRRFGTLLALAGCTWMMGDWANPAIDVPIAFTIGLALGSLPPAIIVHALLVFDRGRLVASDGLLVGLGYLIFGGLMGLVPTLTFDSAALGCAFCPDVVMAVAPAARISDWSVALGMVGGVGWTATVVVWLMVRLRTSSPAGRWLRAPVMGPGAAYLLAVGLELWRSMGTTLSTDATAQALRLVQATLLIALAIGVALEAVRARWSRDRVARVVTDLRRSPPPGGLRDALANIMDDSDLRIAYPIGDGRHADARGRDIVLNEDPPAGRQLTPIIREGAVVAILDHRIEVLDTPATIDDVVRAARLGLEHERLQAATRAQLADLSAARKRIVATADDERKRLERDLHDGAQQHLIALSVRLRLLADEAAGHDRETLDIVDAARLEIGLAIEELREVAHGIYPSILADEGLAAAVEGLSEATGVLVSPGGLDFDRLDPNVEAAAYAVVAGVSAAATGPVRVAGERSGDDLVLTVSAHAVPADVIEELADRVGAIDGRLDVELDKARDGLSLRAVMPCGS